MWGHPPRSPLTIRRARRIRAAASATVRHTRAGSLAREANEGQHRRDTSGQVGRDGAGQIERVRGLLGEGHGEPLTQQRQTLSVRQRGRRHEHGSVPVRNKSFPRLLAGSPVISHQVSQRQPVLAGHVVDPGGCEVCETAHPQPRCYLTDHVSMNVKPLAAIQLRPQTMGMQAPVKRHPCRAQAPQQDRQVRRRRARARPDLVDARTNVVGAWRTPGGPAATPARRGSADALGTGRGPSYSEGPRVASGGQALPSPA